jgi:hypothetical protein
LIHRKKLGCICIHPVSQILKISFLSLKSISMRLNTSVLFALAMLTNVYFCSAQNEVELLPDGIVVPRMSTAPANASSTEGQFYYNTTADQFEYFDGSSWQPLVGSSGPSFTPYKIEDLVNADTYVITTDKSAAGLGDDISIGVDGIDGMRINSLATKDLRLEFMGSENIVIGEDAADNKSGGSKNVFVGNSVAANDAVSSNNTVIGSGAAVNGFGPFGENVIIGTEAGNTGGGQNVYLGYQSGNGNRGVGNVFIGYTAGKDLPNVSRKLIIDTNLSAGLNNPLIEGSFSTGTVTIGGDLEILPEGGLPLPGQTQGNSHLKMLDSNGNMDEIIRRSGTNNDVVIGDVNANGGDLNFRADGSTHLSVLSDGTVKFWRMANAPGTCNSSRAGQVYYDSDDDKLKACGKSFGLFGWHNMF